MRVALALAALLFVAAPSWAVTHNVTDDATLNTAMTTASAGDLINIAAASYTGTFVPTNSGTAGSPIRIVGSQSAPSTVATTQGLSWAEGTARAYISWTGIKVSDDVTWWRANFCSLTYARVDSGGLYLRRTNSDVTSGGASQGNVISDCTFTQNVNAAYVTLLQGAYENTIRRCRFYGTTTAATFDAGRGRYLFRSPNNTFTDCLLSIEAWGATNGEQQAHGLRDSSRFNVFTRDTMLLGMTSRGARRALLSQSGSAPGTADYNSWVDCYYRSYATNDGGSNAGFEFQDSADRTLVIGCQFISRTGVPFAISGNAQPDSMVMRHCSFYTGGSQVYRYESSTNVTTARFNGNAHLARAAGSCASDATGGYRLETLGASAQSDSNAFFFADTTYAFSKGTGGALLCYTPAAWRTATSNDLASRSYVLAGGVVTDTAWATLDLRPATSSVLVSALYPDGYAGAFDAEAPPDPEPDAADECTCPPDHLFDLRFFYRRECDL